MVKLIFDDLKFEDKEDKIKVVFLKIFYFNLDKDKLSKIAKFRIDGNDIVFEDITERKARQKLVFLFEDGFRNLKNSITGKKTIYIHKNLGIPLIGNISFGMIDRGTSVIEVKPITGCNIDCIYCSVDQNKRTTDFVVEKDYIVNELKEIIEFKSKHSKDPLEAHIGSNGEPLLYDDMIPLIEDISAINGIKTISMETNGTLLTKKTVDELINAGLTQFNLSINAFTQGKAEQIANSKAYNLGKIMKIARYIAAKKVNLIIAPVWIPGLNDDEIEKLIEFSKEIKADIGIQNFLSYKQGKRPADAMDFDDFIVKLKTLEIKCGIELLNKHASITQIKALPKPFKKGEIIDVEIKCDGRFKDEKIAVKNNRNISVLDCNIDSGIIKVKIIRSKHNIFLSKTI